MHSNGFQSVKYEVCLACCRGKKKVFQYRTLSWLHDNDDDVWCWWTQQLQLQPVNTACQQRSFCRCITNRLLLLLFFLQGTGDQMWFRVHGSNTVPATPFSRVNNKTNIYPSTPVQFISPTLHSSHIRKEKAYLRLLFKIILATMCLHTSPSI